MKKNPLKEEEKFHDAWAGSINVNDLLIEESFEAVTAPENRIICAKLGRIKGKKILELGCGAGEASVFFAKRGAIVTATDISSGMLNVAKKLAKRHNTHLKTVQCFSNKTPFKEESFDIVYAANLLHHVVSDDTLKEVRRVLKKGGVFVSWDPLDHNFFINVYRRIATQVRTADEHPIQFPQLKKLNTYFKRVEIETTWFFTLLIFFKFYFIDRINPNKERYWKKIISDHKKIEKMYSFLERVDIILLKLVPGLKKYCWNVVIYAKK